MAVSTTATLATTATTQPRLAADRWIGVEFSAISQTMEGADALTALLNAENFPDVEIVVDSESTGLWVWFVGSYLCRPSGMAPCVDLVIVSDEPNSYNLDEDSEEPNPLAVHHLMAWAVLPIDNDDPYVVDTYVITDSVRLLRSGEDLTSGALVQPWYCDPEYHYDVPDPPVLPAEVDPGRLYTFLNAPTDVEPGEVLPASLAMTVIDGEIVIIDNVFVNCFRYEPGL